MDTPTTDPASLHAPIYGPVRVEYLGSFPRVIAGRVPVTPINLALKARLTRGATFASLRSYACSARLYLEYVANREQSLLGVTLAEFDSFVAALVGEVYLDADGKDRSLGRGRSPQTAQNVVSRLYGLAGDLEEAYKVTFAWRRYEQNGGRAIRGSTGFTRLPVRVRHHRFRVPSREPGSLPAEQFDRAVESAFKKWGQCIEDGDRAFARNPEFVRGALFWRNLALLMVMRFAGARRAEVAPLDFPDVDRAENQIKLVTKGRAGGREPVLLLPIVAAAISKYALEYRPFERCRRNSPTAQCDKVNSAAVFLSHSTNSYGRRISSETVRYVVDQLRPSLDEPWRHLLRPHLLRHTFAHELQNLVGPFGASANMRHRSLQSMDPYRDTALSWADQLTEMNDEAARSFAALGIKLP